MNNNENNNSHKDPFKDLSPDFRVDMCPLKVTYEEKDLLKLAEQLKWQGSGTEEDPYIITSSDGLAKEFRILQSNLNIQFKECPFDIIWLRESQNIRLEKISFKKLVLEKCQSNAIKECDLPFLSLADSQNNYFEQCIISSGYNTGSSANIFRNCQFAEGIAKIIKKGTFSHAIKYIFLLTLILGAAFFYFLISSDFKFTLENSVYLIGFGGGFFICVFLCVSYWFGRVPSTHINYIIVDNNSKG